MQKYRVLVNGHNLLVDIDGVRKRHGFYTNVFVEAITPSDAEERAFDVLRQDADLRDATLNAADDPVRFTADEVHAIESFEGLRLPRQGLGFYPEEPDGTEAVA
jgi:hypothetical protein